jgi:hypothetical protein
MTNSIRRRAASDAGIEPDQAEAAVTSVLRSLHRLALLDAKGLSAVALAMRTEMGPEACYHLFGLLELERLQFSEIECGNGVR